MIQAVGEIINFHHHPFGNNYFATKGCGSGSRYSSDVRHCWATKCVDSDSPADDCFTGNVVSQHGADERAVNKMAACAITLTNGTAGWREYWPFNVCMERLYESAAVKATKTCADESGLDYDALMTCYNGPLGVAAEVREAKATTDHQGTPWITVNGKQTFPDSVLAEVCAAYTGAAPAGCNRILDSRRIQV